MIAVVQECNGKNSRIGVHQANRHTDMNGSPTVNGKHDLADLQARYLDVMVPAITSHAKIFFRQIPCVAKKEDKIQECIALGWKWFVNLAKNGRDGTDFPSGFATLIVRAVKSGRRLAGMLKAKDVFTERTQAKCNFRVESLPSSTAVSHESIYGKPHGQQLLDCFEDRLKDNSITPPDEAAAFRIDFPDWLLTRSHRDRRLINGMARNERTSDLSNKFGVSPGRISQLRVEFHDDWERFCDGPNPREEMANANA